VGRAAPRPKTTASQFGYVLHRVNATFTGSRNTINVPKIARLLPAVR